MLEAWEKYLDDPAIQPAVVGLLKGQRELAELENEPISRENIDARLRAKRRVLNYRSKIEKYDLELKLASREAWVETGWQVIYALLFFGALLSFAKGLGLL